MSLQKKLVDVGGPLNGLGNVEAVEFDRSANADDPIRYAANIRFDLLHPLVLNCKRYSERRGMA